MRPSTAPKGKEKGNGQNAPRHRIERRASLNQQFNAYDQD